MKPGISNSHQIVPAVVALLVFSAALGAQELIPFENMQSLLAPSGTWISTGNLRQGRDGHTATLLLNGSVLVAGGENNGISLNSSELYNPTTGTWAFTTGHLNIDRSGAQAVLLSNGKVLVAGGCTSNCLDVTASAELYNPLTGLWSITGNLSGPRAFFAMTVLKSGLVLAAGGCTTLDVNGNCTAVTNDVDIYNPATGAWTGTGSMRAGRAFLTATLLPSGSVLVAGGTNAAGDALRSTELYNATTGGWTLTGPMNQGHSEHTATLLATIGKVLVAGGENFNGVSGNQAELYNPVTGKWTFTGNLRAARQDHTATLLANGKVLVAAGENNTATTTTILASAELYDPTTGMWSTTGRLRSARTGHTATRLKSGLVLAASGDSPIGELTSAELYTP